MDKTERLLRMMEHPEQYSDEQLQELLSDEDCHELYETMRLSASAFEAEDAKEKIAKGIKAEEWQKFERKAGHTTKRVPFLLRRETIHQVAAAFICLLMLSGITYAAVHIISSSQETQGPKTEAIVNTKTQKNSHELAEQDSTLQKSIVYEDAELVTILDDIATFYEVEPVYKKETSKHIRFYFTWDKKQSLDTIIDTFNKFERIHITRYDKILIIE